MWNIWKNTQKLYKEDWENDKDLIYYPVHITPAYEAVVEGSKILSDVRNLFLYVLHSSVIYRIILGKL